jgi:hypothetical protein
MSEDACEKSVEVKESRSVSGKGQGANRRGGGRHSRVVRERERIEELVLVRATRAARWTADVWEGGLAW